MKFKIRYADQIVGALAIFALVALLVLVFVIGSEQRWFSHDVSYKTIFSSASGISAGMKIQYKGFPVGKISKITLTDEDEVEATVLMYYEYSDRVKVGSLLELNVSPIGLGSSLLFHPGKGETILAENSLLPRTDSLEGIKFVEEDLVLFSPQEDTVTTLIAKLNPLLNNLNGSLSEIQLAFNGKGKGPLAKTMNNLADISSSLGNNLDGILSSTSILLSKIAELSSELETTKGIVPYLLDSDGKIMESIHNSLNSVEGTLSALEDSAKMLRGQVPQLSVVLEEVRATLVDSQAVLEGLENNPLLRNGISPRTDGDVSGAAVRNLDF